MFIVPLAGVIGFLSVYLLFATLRNAYWDYWVYPKLKAADPGLYIYPQLRYTVFDLALLVWCLDGLIASGTSLWAVVSSGGIGRLAYRTMVLYFGLLIGLMLGGGVMLYVRSRGF